MHKHAWLCIIGAFLGPVAAGGCAAAPSPSHSWSTLAVGDASPPARDASFEVGPQPSGKACPPDPPPQADAMWTSPPDSDVCCLFDIAGSPPLPRFDERVECERWVKERRCRPGSKASFDGCNYHKCAGDEMTETSVDEVCARFANVSFTARSARLSAATLDELFASDLSFVTELKQFVAHGRVRVVGYAGEAEGADPESRRSLALERSRAVERVIVGAGIQASRVAVESWDGLDPVFEGDAAVRVQVVLDPFSIEYPPGPTSPPASFRPRNRTTILAAGQTLPRGVAVDRASVYFLTGGWLANSGAVVKVPLRGGAPVELASQQGGPWDIAVDDASVYWTNVNDGTIMKVPIGGGTPAILASGQNLPQALTVDATTVYWTNAGQQRRDLRYTIRSVAKSGGDAVTLFSNVRPATKLAHDAAYLYWISDNDIVKAPLGGGTPVKLVEALMPYDIHVDATNVYWINAAGNGNSSVMQVPIGGGTPFEIASKQSARGIALDSDSIYWTNDGPPGAGTVMKALLRGGTAIILATGQPAPNVIAVDATSVYWVNSGNDPSGIGSVAMTKKK